MASWLIEDAFKMPLMLLFPVYLWEDTNSNLEESFKGLFDPKIIAQKDKQTTSECFIISHSCLNCLIIIDQYSHKICHKSMSAFTKMYKRSEIFQN